MSASQSREWITSGSPVSRAAAIWLRKPCCLRLARAVVVEIVEPRLADRHDLRMLGERRRVALASMSSSSCAWCGCVPTEQNTSGNRSAIASDLRMAFDPCRDRHHAADAGRARAPTTASSSAAKSGKSRWQWLSTSMVQRLLLPARRSAGKPAQVAAAWSPALTRRSAKRGETPARPRAQRASRAISRPTSAQKAAQGCRPAAEFQPSHRAPCPAARDRSWREPTALRREIAIGIGHDRPDAVEHLVQLLRLHVLAGRADHRVGGSKNGLVGIAERARLRQFAAESACRSSTASAAPGCRGRSPDPH